MSLEAVRQILGKAILDPAFRQQFVSSPDAAMHGFQLSGAEQDALRQVTPQQLDGLKNAIRSSLDGMDFKFKQLADYKPLADFFYKPQVGGAGNLVKGEIFQKLLDGALHKEQFFFKMQSSGQVTEVEVLGYDDGMTKEVIGHDRTSDVTGSRGILIGLSLTGILIGLLLFLPAEGLMPMMGLSNITPTNGEMPACPSETEEGWHIPNPPEGVDENVAELPPNLQFMLFLSPFRDVLGDPLCLDEGDENQAGGDPAPPTGGQSTGGAAAECGCVGPDYICKNADGSVGPGTSYNAAQCGGSGVCGCREPNKTWACPDGTFADFNPQCGVDGGSCTCVKNPACDQFPNNCPDPYFICQENGQSCKP